LLNNENLIVCLLTFRKEEEISLLRQVKEKEFQSEMQLANEAYNMERKERERFLQRQKEVEEWKRRRGELYQKFIYH